MAKAKTPLDGDWFRLTSAHKGREGKGLLIRAGDIWALHEGQEAGTTLIEFDPMAERAPELVFQRFETFCRDYVDAWDARGRRPRKRKGPAEASPPVVAFKRS
jgi:hypothetical protein